MNLSTKLLQNKIFSLVIGSILTFSLLGQASAHQPNKVKSLAAIERSNEKVARDFIASFATVNVDKIIINLAKDLKHKSLMGNLEGKDNFAKSWTMMLSGVKSIDSDILRLSVMGNVVLMERKDVVVTTERTVRFQLISQFVIENGKIIEFNEFSLPTAQKMKMKKELTTSDYLIGQLPHIPYPALSTH